MATPSKKVIITCAVTGSIHTPTMTPHLPITPKEIADESIAAAKAGAAIIHLHARDPKDGRPTPDPKVFMAFLPEIKAGTDAVINITTGGGHNMTVQERLAAPLQCQPEMCSFNMGSMMHMRAIANKLFGDGYEWSVLAAGRHQMALTTMAGICGGNVRVGLEDSIFLAKGRLAKSNAEQVAKIRRILEDLSLEIATPMEARQRLALKGMEKVAF